MAGSLTLERLAGVWQLTMASYERAGTGEPVPSHYGDDPVGVLHYTPGGRMSALIMRTGLPLLGPDHLKADDGDKARAFSGVIAYAGRYVVEGDVVVHHVLAATIPDWVGTEQRRHVALDGDGMVLRSAPQTSGRVITARWRRIE